MKHGSQHARTETILRFIMEGTSIITGEAFFYELVRHLALALGVRYAFVSEFTEVKTRVRSLAFWDGEDYRDNVEYILRGTPCEKVLCGEVAFYPKDVQTLFPDDRDLINLKADSYLAIPLIDRHGIVLGHLAAINDKPMIRAPNDMSIFKIFGARAVAELERIRAETALQHSEKRFRDLYDEAPIAYLSIEVDGKITTANRQAIELFGNDDNNLVGHEVIGLVAESLAGKPMAREVFRKALDGKASQDQEIEMRRANGDVVWANLTVQPMFDPAGHVISSRALLVNITERKLAEEGLRELRAENISLQEEITRPIEFQELVGDSAKMQGLYKEIEAVANTEATVLIAGETGTGKELIARTLHKASGRRDKILIKINCAALPSELIESELFGHEKGAFTGATQQRKGRFELADSGTIFLDEVGELSPPAQAKLLRVLQEQEFERVGGAKTLKVDVRVIAATNRDLIDMVSEGTFRSDLYYRLNVFPLRVPPLRERPTDIPRLARNFLSKLGRKLGRTLEDISPDSMHKLQRYHWPGNVRELQNIIERAAILTKGRIVEINDVLIAQPDAISASTALGSLEEVERNHIVHILDACDWVVEGKQGAAVILGLKPSTLRFRMQKLNISKPQRLS